MPRPSANAKPFDRFYFFFQMLNTSKFGLKLNLCERFGFCFFKFNRYDFRPIVSEWPFRRMVHWITHTCTHICAYTFCWRFKMKAKKKWTTCNRIFAWVHIYFLVLFQRFICVVKTVFLFASIQIFQNVKLAIFRFFVDGDSIDGFDWRKFVCKRIAYRNCECLDTCQPCTFVSVLNHF